uniref:Tyrosine-protein kinase n=1 Tax=Arion vulgaris TaxID=1028688 RepID=A0A0B6YSM1_9EUPU
MMKKVANLIGHNRTQMNNNEQDEDPGIPRVYSEPYFYGRITRQEAEEIMTINGKEDGQYLLRESITPMGNFSLTMAYQGNIVHYSIEKKIDGQYMIAEGVAFPDPVSLIQHYQNNNSGFVTVPRIPCSRSPQQEAIAFRGLSYRDLHSHMKETAKNMNASLSRALGSMRESLLMLVLRTMHEKMPWYHGVISREECIKRLEESGHTNGKFIIRKRADSQTFALTMSCDEQMRHYFILVNDGETYSIENGQRFKALVILVDHYHNKRDGLPCKLTIPCASPNVKHQAYENYIRLHNNLTQKPGNTNVRRPSPPNQIKFPNTVHAQSQSYLQCNVKTPDRPPPPIPRQYETGGAMGTPPIRRQPIFPPEITVPDEVTDEEENVPVPLSQSMSHEEAERLESVYIDIREDVMSTDLRPEQVKLEGKLGSGQFGEVKKGICQLLNKYVPVAVKTLKNNDPAGEKEILREATLMKKLDHQHIVRMIGVCKGESLMLVMELAELGPLKKYLEKNLDMKVWHQVEMILQICLGMQYLESTDVVHRDLATRNVLLVTEHFAKISDFGMSRILDSGSEYYLAHGPGRWPLMWYAPECLYYHKFDTKSDVWSFGVTLWEIMSFGARPYDKRKPQEILHYVESGNRLHKPRNCDDRIYNLMLSCWDLSKEKRPTFREMGTVLGRLYNEFKKSDV